MKKGDPILFVDNAQYSQGENYAQVFYKIAGLELGFYAIFYSGIDTTPPLNVGANLETDFERSRALVVYLGQPKSGRAMHDHWGLARLNDALKKNLPCFVYVAPDFPRELLKKAGFNFEPTVISSHEEFANKLRGDLRRLLTV